MSGLALRARERTTECGRCGRAYERAAWEALRVVERLGHDELRDLLSEWPWPAETYLEVRQCRCGGTIARLR